MSEMTPQLFTELIKATYEFGDAYHKAAVAKDESDTSKTAFYAKADEALALRRLAQKSIVVYDEEVVAHVKTHHPGWRVVESTPSEKVEGEINVIIEQDPSQMKYSFTNLEDGHHYQRTYTEGAPQLDEERLQEEDPDLYDDIHQWPDPPAWLGEFLRYMCGLKVTDEDVADDWTTFLDEASHGVEASIKPVSEWTKDQKAALQKYLVPGQRMMKIVKPRKATEEEIEEAIALLDELATEAE